MDYPRTCDTCPSAMGCCTYYGGSLCRYTNQINRAAIDAVLKTKEETQT